MRQRKNTHANSFISRLTVKCATQNLVKICSSSLWTCLQDLLLRGNSNHSSNGVLHAVVCVRVVHSKIGVDAIKYNP